MPGVAQAAELPARLPAGTILEASLDGEEASYVAAVEGLLARYEEASGFVLYPGPRAAVALKVDTRSGNGLATPRALLSAVILALEQRGFERDAILIVDLQARTLREAGILPPLSERSTRYEGCPVYSLEDPVYHDEAWFYDSPLPPSRREAPGVFSAGQSGDLVEGDVARKSFLPTPLLFDVDFWINLAVVSDEPVLGVDGVLANATLWGISNGQRFLANEATASSAIAEVAAIPELNERMALHMVPLDRFQYIGGPFFNAHYTRSIAKLWAGTDPVALDRMMLEKINRVRRLEGFREIEPMPLQLRYAASLGLGTYKMSEIRIEAVETP